MLLFDKTKTIQYNNGNGFLGNWDENGRRVNTDFDLDKNGCWTYEDDYNNAGIKVLYVRALIDGEWVNSDPVKVTVSSEGQVGAIENLALAEATVTRGETAILNYYSAASNSDEDRYELHHNRDRSNDGDEQVKYDLNNVSSYKAMNKIITGKLDEVIGEHIKDKRKNL